MNDSIEPTRISDRTASRAGRQEQYQDRDPRGPGRARVTLRVAVPAEGLAGVRELVHERQDVADHQDDRDIDRLLGQRALLRVARREGEDGRDEQADDRQDEQRGVRRRDLPAERLRPVAQAADQHARPEDQQQVPDDRAGQRRLDDLDQAGLEREERDDQLGDVAEGRVEDARRPAARSATPAARSRDRRPRPDRGSRPPTRGRRASGRRGARNRAGSRRQ